jgi:hypothetical protein
MLYAKVKFLSTTELPARDPFPPSTLVSLLDQDSGETFNLIARAGAEQFAALNQLDDVVVQLAYRRLDLTTLGGRGKAWKLSVQSVLDTKAVR